MQEERVIEIFGVFGQERESPQRFWRAGQVVPNPYKIERERESPTDASYLLVVSVDRDWEDIESRGGCEVVARCTEASIDQSRKARLQGEDHSTRAEIVDELIYLERLLLHDSASTRPMVAEIPEGTRLVLRGSNISPDAYLLLAHEGVWSIRPNDFEGAVHSNNNIAGHSMGTFLLANHPLANQIFAQARRLSA